MVAIKACESEGLGALIVRRSDEDFVSLRRIRHFSNLSTKNPKLVLLQPSKANNHCSCDMDEI